MTCETCMDEPDGGPMAGWTCGPCGRVVGGGTSERLSVLATFAHEVAGGAFRSKELRDAALLALKRANLSQIDDVVALTAAGLKGVAGNRG